MRFDLVLLAMVREVSRRVLCCQVIFDLVFRGVLAAVRIQVQDQVSRNGQEVLEAEVDAEPSLLLLLLALLARETRPANELPRRCRVPVHRP